MKQLVNTLGDRLQATFPPNRIMLILAAPIVAASAWISAVVTANVPGVDLPIGIVAGVVGAAVLIAITLIYKWFDQWQAGEPIDINHDLEHAYDEIVESQSAIDALLGATHGFGQALAELRSRVVDGMVNPAEIADELEAIGVAVNQVIQPPEAEVVSESAADAAPPTAAAAT